MKAEIIASKLVLFPESETEFYAIQHWFDHSTIHYDDTKRASKAYVILENFSIREDKI